MSPQKGSPVSRQGPSGGKGSVCRRGEEEVSEGNQGGKSEPEQDKKGQEKKTVIDWLYVERWIK